MYTAGKWSRATPVPTMFADEPRRCLSRELNSLGRTLERTEVAALNAQIAALKATNEMLIEQLNGGRKNATTGAMTTGTSGRF
jgi:hypothetical protein